LIAVLEHRKPADRPETREVARDSLPSSIFVELQIDLTEGHFVFDVVGGQRMQKLAAESSLQRPSLRERDMGCLL
jgi:hypothetical protein